MTTGRSTFTKVIKFILYTFLIVVFLFILKAINDSFEGYSVQSVNGFYSSSYSSYILHFNDGDLKIYSSVKKYSSYSYTLKDGYVYIDESACYLITKGGLIDEETNVFYTKVNGIESIEDFS